MMKTKSMYSGWRKGVGAAFGIVLILTLMLSIERTVIDALGEMWTVMLLNCTATACSAAGLLGICARERIVFALYAVWSVIASALNFTVVLIYNDIGLLTHMEYYFGKGDNFWKIHGLFCKNTYDGSGYNFSGEGGTTMEPESDTCLMLYSVVETLHACVFIFLAIMSLILSMLLICSKEKQRKYSLYESYEDIEDEDFGYVNLSLEYNTRNRNIPGIYNTHSSLIHL